MLRPRAIAALSLALPSIAFSQVVTTEPFLGIKHHAITQTLPRPLNIDIVEIDLTAPTLRFRMSPRDPGLPNGDETITQTTRQFANEQSAQVAINTSFFRLESSGLSLPTNNLGLAVSDGDRYSPWDATGEVGLNLSATKVATIVTAPSNRPTGFETNPAGTSLFNATRGSHRLLNNGNNVAPADSTVAGDFLHLQPRTAAGVTNDNRLLLVTVDGRQPGFSEGMYLSEVAELLKGRGAINAVNLDGGGSTTLAFDYYGDGATRSQLVNRPVGRGTPGSERFVGQSLAVFASANPNFTPPTGVVPVPPTPTNVRVLDSFEDGPGRFTTDPDFSGSNRGLLETADGAGPSTAERDANQFLHGFAAHRINIVDDPAVTGQLLRLLSGGGSPANNAQLGTTGYVGFWLKTSTPGLRASIGLDENLTTVIESATPLDVIPDGQWHLYEWNLADPAQWESFANGDGDIDGPVTTVDSILISSPTDQDANLWIDAIAYNPTGRLTLVPEPATALLFLSLPSLLLRRRSPHS